ncbi:hypothetical protein AAW12_18595 [Sphingobacterium sp. Ag1]|nr:hypothetical protein AAW12_18595 [Sphingobacterium sp. Ag1]
MDEFNISKILDRNAEVSNDVNRLSSTIKHDSAFELVVRIVLLSIALFFIKLINNYEKSATLCFVFA